MKISKLALIALLGGALAAFGCSSDSNDGGAGSGGAGGAGGDGGGGGAPSAMCEPVDGECGWGTFDAITQCDDCTLATPPTQTNACDGTESTVNPDTCAAGAGAVTYKLTLMAIAPDCSVGFDLDSCAGETCTRGMLASDDGAEGVDNGLASLTPKIEPLGTSLTGVDQAFYDSLCGATDDLTVGVCESGSDEGKACEGDADCADGASCNTENDDCLEPITAAQIFFTVDANVEANCAAVEVRSVGACSEVGNDCTSDDDCGGDTDICEGGGTSTSFLNLGTPTAGGTVCASGELEDIPMQLVGIAGVLGNPVVQMTISADGFSDGVLGATVDSDTATAIANAISPIAAGIVASTFDISATLTQDTTAACDALSMTLNIGGVTEAP